MSQSLDHHIVFILISESAVGIEHMFMRLPSLKGSAMVTAVVRVTVNLGRMERAEEFQI
jgi:hypothetical protein